MWYVFTLEKAHKIIIIYYSWVSPNLTICRVCSRTLHIYFRAIAQRKTGSLGEEAPCLGSQRGKQQLQATPSPPAHQRILLPLLFGMWIIIMVSVAFRTHLVAHWLGAVTKAAIYSAQLRYYVDLGMIHLSQRRDTVHAQSTVQNLAHRSYSISTPTIGLISYSYNDVTGEIYLQSSNEKTGVRGQLTYPRSSNQKAVEPRIPAHKH